MFHDLRHSCRALLRSPGFTAVVIATLAIAIGANLTVFSLMRAVLWRPLPYPDPDRIVRIQVDARNGRDTGATLGEIYDVRNRARSLERVSTIDPTDANVEYAGGEHAGEMEHVAASRVSDDFLPLLGARAALGRLPEARLDEPDGRLLGVVIGDEFWRRRFSADPGVLGRSLRVNGVDVRIAGVVAPGFRLFLPPSLDAAELVDVWLPFPMSSVRQYRGNSIAARLSRGVTPQGANSELQALAAQFTRDYPDSYRGFNLYLTAIPLRDEMTRDARPVLFLLAGAVAFVLLIACANVANLMLARGSGRRRELAIRRALGAGTLRVIRQLLAESLLLAIVAGVFGVLCARLGLAAIARFGNSHIPLQSRIALDGPVAAFGVALSLLTCVLFGLLPAWRLASGETTDPLRAGRTETAGSGARGLQRALVVAEVALSIAPLACGGLMLRSLINLIHAPLGFNPANLVTAEIPVNSVRLPDIHERWPWLREILDRVKALPGVESVSAANPLPLASGQQVRRVGRADRLGSPPIAATQQFAAPGYLSTIGTPLVLGRDFTGQDIALQRSVTIIDSLLANRLWPEGAVGKHLVVFRTGWRNDLEVIGVTSAVRMTRVRDDGPPHYVMPYSNYPASVSLVVKTRETPARIASGIRRAVDAAHTGMAAFGIRAMSDYVADSVGDTSFTLFVLAAFAGASLLLAAGGLYGTLAFLTEQRTREFGIRLALGSTARAIVGIVMREGVLLAAAGTALGLAGVTAVTGAIRQLLYGVRPLDISTLAGVVALVAAVALAATVAPARRASRNDPQAALRSE